MTHEPNALRQLAQDICEVKCDVCGKFGQNFATVFNILERSHPVQQAPACDGLREAAQAVVDRWDSPTWKDLPHTGESIDRLRQALAAPQPTVRAEDVKKE